MRDSPRWCDVCGQYGDHHTESHDTFEDSLAARIMRQQMENFQGENDDPGTAGVDQNAE